MLYMHYHYSKARKKTRVRVLEHSDTRFEVKYNTHTVYKRIHPSEKFSPYFIAVINIYTINVDGKYQID